MIVSIGAGECHCLPANADANAPASGKSEVVAGKLVSGAIQRSLRSIAFDTDCIVEQDVDKGWITDIIRFKVTGTGQNVVQFFRVWTQYASQLK